MRVIRISFAADVVMNRFLFGCGDGLEVVSQAIQACFHVNPILLSPCGGRVQRLRIQGAEAPLRLASLADQSGCRGLQCPANRSSGDIEQPMTDTSPRPGIQRHFLARAQVGREGVLECLRSSIVETEQVAFGVEPE